MFEKILHITGLTGGGTLLAIDVTQPWLLHTPSGNIVEWLTAVSLAISIDKKTANVSGFVVNLIKNLFKKKV